MIPFPYPPAKPDKQANMRKSERLGRLLNFYHRDTMDVMLWMSGLLGRLLNFYHRDTETETKEEAPAAA